MYRITYIDGHDLKYKKFYTDADSKDAALDALHKKYENFDHQIIDITDCKKLIGDNIKSYADKKDFYISDSEIDLIISMWFPREDITWKEAAEWTADEYESFVYECMGAVTCLRSHK